MLYKYFGSDTRFESAKWKMDIDYKTEPLSEFNIQKGSFRCLCCRTSREQEAFPMITNPLFGFYNDSGAIKAPICCYCLDTLYNRYVELDETHDEMRALYRLCAFLDVYYSHDIAFAVFNDKDRRYKELGGSMGRKLPSEHPPKYMPWVFLYLRTIATEPDTAGKTFYNSRNDQFIACVSEQHRVEEEEKEEVRKEGPTELSPTARENRSQVMSIFHIDPFENDTIEDREVMYNDLVTMADDAMTDDLVRQKAAIEIVRTFKRIDKLSEAIRKLQETPESIVANEKQLKSLVEQKSKETALVTSFSKDHGFAEKYAVSKSKGSGTLSAIVRDMKDAHYDRGAVNRFDIETAAAIRQVSDISAESIFKQVGFSDSEYAAMVKEQAEEIVKLREKADRAEEELRLVKEKYLKQELLDELESDLRSKSVPEEDIRNIINKEYHR